MNRLALICACVVLCGCATEASRSQNEQIDRARAQYDFVAQCHKENIAEGTPEFRQCMDKLDREADRGILGL
jgi:hypothetical protein